MNVGLSLTGMEVIAHSVLRVMQRPREAQTGAAVFLIPLCRISPA
jgi:hypothetical protein